MDWSTIQNAIKEWAEDSTSLEAVWMNQARPMSQKPFIVLQITSTSKEGVDSVDYEYVATPTTHLEPVILGYRLINVQVMAISRNQNAGQDAIQYLELARTRLNRPVLKEALRQAGLAINWTSHAILVQDVIFQNRYESRAVLDVTFRTTQVDSFTDEADNEQYIERAEVSSELGNANDSLDLVDEIIGIPV